MNKSSNSTDLVVGLSEGRQHYSGLFMVTEVYVVKCIVPFAVFFSRIKTNMRSLTRSFDTANTKAMAAQVHLGEFIHGLTAGAITTVTL